MRSVLTGCTLVAESGVAPENCVNGIDDDLDGRIDCADLDCGGGGACPSGEVDPRTLSGTCTGTWRSSREGTHCEPWGPNDWSECDNPTLHRPTTAVGCVPIGDERCRGPSGLVPGDVFLDTAAAPGGDGTLTAPFDSVADALAAVADRGTIVFRGTIALPPIERSISFAGVCPAESVITGGMQIDGTNDGYLENLAIHHEDGVALRIGVGTRRTLDQVGVRGELVVAGGFVTAHRSSFVGAHQIEGATDVNDMGGTSSSFGSLIVDHSTFGTLLGQAEPCLTASGSFVTVDDVVFEKCPATAIAVSEVVVPDVPPSPTSIFIDHSVFTNLSGVGVESEQTSGLVEIADSLVRRSRVNEEPFLRMRAGQGSLRGTVLQDGDGPAVDVSGGSLQLEDVLITGASVRVSGGQLGVEQVELTGFPSYAIDVTAGTVTLEGLRLRGRDSDGGVRAAAGTELAALDFVFEEPGVCGFELEGGVTLDVSDGVIAGADAGFCVPAGVYLPDEFSQRIDTTLTASPVDER